jgi:hypothetical protein
MANRVLLGQRGGAFGLWVSRPGVDVVTAGEDDMLFSSGDTENFMIIDSGVIGDPGAGATSTVSIPSMGFSPFVIFSCEKYPVSLEYLSSTSIRFRTFAAISVPGDSGVVRSGTIRYAVTNLPV